MEHYKLSFLNILKAALHGQTAQPDDTLTPEDWTRILALAQEHSVLPLIFEAVYPLPGMRTQSFMAMRKPHVMQQVMTQTMKTSAFLGLNRHLRSSGITPIIVKGIVCRNLYPLPDHRQSGDEDLLIPEDQYDACHEAMTACGMQLSNPEMDRQSAYEVPYGKPGSPIYIELHKHLFPPESEAYGDLNRFFEGVFDRAVVETIQGSEVLTMCPTDHFFYLICHSFKHFLHSGFGIRQVCDIALFARRYDAQIHWEQVLENCRAIRAEKFTAALLRIGENYLGIPAPAIWQSVSVDETPILEDLLSSGVFGSADSNRIHSSSITLAAVADQKQGKKSGSGLMKSLFPSAKTLEGRYPYLQKQPWLLPVAWVSRIAKYSTEVQSGSQSSAADAIRIGNERVSLLKEYDILDD